MSQPFQPIPISQLESDWRGHVHVEGWNPACVFIFDGIGGLGEYRLRTPKSCRRYRTNNRLLYTRGNEPFSATSTPSATTPPRKPGATTPTGAKPAVPAGSGLEIDDQGSALLTSKIPRPEQTVDHPFAGMTKAAQH